MRYWILLCVVLTCCNRPESPPSTNWQEIAGRALYADSNTRFPIYRAKVPLEWKKKIPVENEPLLDTTQALITYTIEEDGKEIRITVHNFPTEKIEQRIPPQAQITRWKKQFEQLDLPTVSIQPQAFSGFSGFVFEGEGRMQGKETTMMGWTMQLAPEHFRALGYPHHAKEQALYNQMQADYTIKIVGDPDLVKKHKQELVAFAHSFEFIHDIPN